MSRRGWLLLALVTVLVAGTFVGARMLLRTDEARGTVAARAPSFEAITLDDPPQVRTLADYAGDVVLLNIWATWCAPCRKEMPSLDRLQAALGGPDFEVVALSLDEDGIADVEAFYGEIGIDHLAIYVDSSGAAMRALRIIGVPTTLLVDVEGHEIGRALGPDQWETPATIHFLQEQMRRTPRP